MSYEAWGEPDEMPEGWMSEDQCAEIAKERFVEGLCAMREMLARFVEQGGGPIRGGPHILLAQSLRANWNPEWGDDPGPPRNMRDHGWLGPVLHDKVAALIASPLPLPEPGEGNAAVADSAATREPISRAATGALQVDEES